MMNVLRQLPAAMLLGERTNVKLYIILTIVAAVLLVLSLVLKLVTKKKK